MQGKVEICGVNTAALPVLKAAETRSLLEKARGGDGEARQKLIAGNLRLVLSVVQRFSNRGESMDDLFQVGVIGLIKAVDCFDLSQGVQFSTYGVPAIMGWRKAKANADPIAFGIFRTIRAPASSLFLAIHKVFLRKSAIAGTQILSESALADRIVVRLKGVFSHDKKTGIGTSRESPGRERRGRSSPTYHARRAAPQPLDGGGDPGLRGAVHPGQWPPAPAH